MTMVLASPGYPEQQLAETEVLGGARHHAARRGDEPLPRGRCHHDRHDPRQQQQRLGKFRPYILS
jgi:hypothetical protein